MVSMQAIHPKALMKRTNSISVERIVDDGLPSNDFSHDNDIDHDSLAVATVDKHGKVKLRMTQHLRPNITRKFLNNSQRNFTNALHEALTGVRLIDHPSGYTNNTCEYEFQHDVSLTTRSTRSGRMPPRRGRAIHTQTAADRFAGHPFQQGPDDTDADGSDDEVPPPRPLPLPKVIKMKSVLIANEKQVKEFLLDRLDRIQQLSDKKIAKAWIKGICPKKQAEYPYQNKRSSGADPELPPFWPPDVKYKEPDHIQKEDRNKLLLHLIRLRPSPEEVRGWNKNQVSLNKTHQLVGWTAFLRELAPPECVDDIDNVKPEKVKKRKEYMKQMYDVATREEEYLCFGMGDETSKYSYPDDDKPVKRSTVRQKKRSRSRCSITDDESRLQSRSSSASRGDRPIAKRVCKDLDAKPVVQSSFDSEVPDTALAREETDMLGHQQQTETVDAATTDMTSVEHVMGSPQAIDQKVVIGGDGRSQDTTNSETGLPTDAEWLASRREVAAMHHQHQKILNERQSLEQRCQEPPQQCQPYQWQAPSPASMSFASASGPPTPPSFDVHQAQTGQSMFPGTHEFRFALAQDAHKPQQGPNSYPHQQHHEQLQEQHLRPIHTQHHHHHLPMQGPPVSEAYPVFNVPQPSFITTPNTPMFSPADMFPQHVPMGNLHEMGPTPAQMHAQPPAMPLQAQQTQHQAYPPVYDGQQLHYPSTDQPRQVFAQEQQTYETYHPPMHYGLPLQHTHGMPLHYLPAAVGYPQHH